jgi:hypothetical protein
MACPQASRHLRSRPDHQAQLEEQEQGILLPNLGAFRRHHLRLGGYRPLAQMAQKPSKKKKKKNGTTLSMALIQNVKVSLVGSIEQ